MPLRSPSVAGAKKQWRMLSCRKGVEKHVSDARVLISRHTEADVGEAVSLLDAALAASPANEEALELKARSLLFLRRFRDVADMLQDHIPSFRPAQADESGSSANSDGSAKLLRNDKPLPDAGSPSGCFSVGELRKKLVAGFCAHSHREAEGQWRYLVLGEACFHLGMMDDALVLLQAGRRLASAAFRRESLSRPEDTFAASLPPSPVATAMADADASAQLLSHTKLILRRRSAAVASLDAGLPSESIRCFSKILDARRGSPRGFAAACYAGRSAAYSAGGRVADAIADCNRALALDAASIPALRARADLLESVNSLPDCLRDLDHLKLLYDSILRDRKLPGPSWRPHPELRYRDVPAGLKAVTARMQKLRGLLAAGGQGSLVDYHKLLGVRRGCSRSELQRAHLVLSLRHRPEKATAFVEKLGIVDDDHRDGESVREQARMSALILYRLLQKGYSSIMSVIMKQEAAEKEKARAAAAAAAAEEKKRKIMARRCNNGGRIDGGARTEEVMKEVASVAASAAVAAAAAAFHCRDVAAGSLMASIPVKYQALSC